QQQLHGAVLLIAVHHHLRPGRFHGLVDGGFLGGSAGHQCVVVLMLVALSPLGALPGVTVTRGVLDGGRFAAPGGAPSPFGYGFPSFFSCSDARSAAAMSTPAASHITCRGRPSACSFSAWSA